MERDVSLVTGRRVAHALERLGHEVHALDVEESTTERVVRACSRSVTLGEMTEYGPTDAC